MELIEIFGFLGALLIGMVLGLIGGGGSILTVPILVYALGINPVLATAYSLFVVGATSLVGAVNNMLKGRVDFKTAFIFAVPAFIAVYLTRAFLIPAIPEVLLHTESFTLSKDLGIMLFFAVIMVLAAVSMIRNSAKKQPITSNKSMPYSLVVLEGFAVGVITGIVGAGGGFLIIPALVLFAKLPMKKAVATSLLIIAIKSLIGFLGDIQNFAIDWGFLLSFTGLSIVGIFIGVWMNKFIDGKKLKKAFGWFVLIMGMYIVYNELA